MPTIDKNIPIPDRAPRGYFTNTLRAMEIGDSVVIPSVRLFSFRCVAYQMGCKISARELRPGEHRIWLTAKPTGGSKSQSAVFDV
jgi:hypothetical protein